MDIQRKIAIIGSGISGITAAYLLDKRFDITLFESKETIGGHTHSHQINNELFVDMGFIVFNHLNYPLFTRFLNQLNVDYQDSDMSFGYYNKQKNFYYSSDFPKGIFAQKKNIFSYSYIKFLKEINTFNKQVLSDIDSKTLKDKNLIQYLESLNLSKRLIQTYILPMGAAIWSCPTSQIELFPAESFFNFWKNHQLLTIGKRPVWKTITNASQSYIKKFKDTFTGTIKTNTPILSVSTNNNHCEITTHSQNVLIFDNVIIATHADQAYKLLKHPTQLQTELLKPWQYSKNNISLHTDETVMPPNKNAWASWLVQQRKNDIDQLTMTYYMNRLQSIKSNHHYFVTLNDKANIDPNKMIKNITFSHPIYDLKSVQTQQSLYQLNTGPLYFCGSYFGNGFHEDGVKSANNVCELLGESLCVS